MWYHDTFYDVLHDYCQRHQRIRSDTTFIYEGERIWDDSSPAVLLMEDEDEIDVCCR